MADSVEPSPLDAMLGLGKGAVVAQLDLEPLGLAHTLGLGAMGGFVLHRE